MLILDIYKEYLTFPSVEDHQFRVAAVAKQICDNLSDKVDTKTIISACLIHDMGNVIKFDFDFALKLYPEYIQTKDVPHWQKIQDVFKARYGTDEEANVKIAEELKVSSKTIELIRGIGFEKIGEISTSNNIERKIVEYADMRVGPHGVMSIQERAAEGRQRYSKRKDRELYPHKQFDQTIRKLSKIEKDLFSQSNIQPTDINDDSIKPLIKQLRTYEI